MADCKKGEISRKEYKRTSKSGKTVTVKRKCIKATSQTGVKMAPIIRKKLSKKRMSHKIAREKFGEIECPKGQIMKEGYHRKSYVKRDSKKIKGSWVAPSCIQDKGNKGKQEQKIYVERERLGKYGYGDVVNTPASIRQKSLKKAIDSGEKPLSVMRRLNALSTLNKNVNPQLADELKRDANWIKQMPEYKKR